MARSLWMGLSLLTAAALAGCATPPAEPQPEPPPAEAPPSASPRPSTIGSDQSFINQAIGMGEAESGMGRLADGKAASKPLRAFAARMTTEHTRANQQLAMLAKRLNLQVAPPPDQPPPELLTTTGPEFDRQYLDLVIKSHQNMIALFESEANNGQDVRVKHYAGSMLPVLRHHLHEAETMAHQAGV